MNNQKKGITKYICGCFFYDDMWCLCKIHEKQILKQMDLYEEIYRMIKNEQ